MRESISVRDPCPRAPDNRPRRLSSTIVSLPGQALRELIEIGVPGAGGYTPFHRRPPRGSQFLRRAKWRDRIHTGIRVARRGTTRAPVMRRRW
jgi:hypothetical protein